MSESLVLLYGDFGMNSKVLTIMKRGDEALKASLLQFFRSVNASSLRFFTRPLTLTLTLALLKKERIIA
jgi:hypothetical protein